MGKRNQWTRATRPMVRWLEPGVLLKSAQEVALSGLFANFADKRELMAGIDPTGPGEPKRPYFDYSGEGAAPFWFDYASDVGDGFSSTVAVAQLLAQDVQLAPDEDPLRRGRFVVLGGDQVYPSASWEDYDVRFRWPYELASADAGPADLYAVPGNHDWYDGLTSFMRLFCQGSRIGEWQTRQRRSYFALRLPHDWWLWAIDIQFDAYIDSPQLDYFTEIAKLTTGADKIILATAKPSWVDVEDPADPPQSWQSLAFFEERVVGLQGARLALTLTGDLHHYARYDRSSDEEEAAGITVAGKLTAGGGGAYLSPTHPLPDRVKLPEIKRTGSTETPPAAEYRRRRAWPDPRTSRCLASGFLAHLRPDRTPSLGLVLGAVYLIAALLIAGAVKDHDPDFADSVTAGFGRLLWDSVSLWLVVFLGGLGFGLRAWALYGGARGGVGVLHAAAHGAVAWLVTLGVLAWAPFGLAEHGFLLGAVAALVTALAGALLGRVILVLYLYGCHRRHPRWHANEVFAGQSLPTYKHFLRFRLEADELTVFAVGLRDVPRYADGQQTVALQPPAPELIEALRVRLPSTPA